MSNASFFPYPDEVAQAPLGFLGSLHDDDVAIILSYTQTQRYARGEVAIRQGDTDRSLFVVTAGRFEVVVRTARSERTMRLAGPGDIFGDLAFFDGQPRSADVRAVEEAEALIMTQSGFERLRLARPHLALALVMDLGRLVSQRYRVYSARLAAMRAG